MKTKSWRSCSFGKNCCVRGAPSSTVSPGPPAKTTIAESLCTAAGTTITGIDSVRGDRADSWRTSVPQRAGRSPALQSLSVSAGGRVAQAARIRRAAARFMTITTLVCRNR